MATSRTPVSPSMATIQVGWQTSWRDPSLMILVHLQFSVQRTIRSTCTTIDLWTRAISLEHQLHPHRCAIHHQCHSPVETNLMLKKVCCSRANSDRTATLLHIFRDRGSHVGSIPRGEQTTIAVRETHSNPIHNAAGIAMTLPASKRSHVLLVSSCKSWKRRSRTITIPKSLPSTLSQNYWMCDTKRSRLVVHHKRMIITSDVLLVQIWFQNRRSRFKRQQKPKASSSSSTSMITPSATKKLIVRSEQHTDWH